MATLSNSGMIRWKMAKDVSKNILNSGGYVFGGFIRDSILHDEAAKSFYSVYNKDNCSENVCKLYNDKNILPDFNDRLILPNDIDCYMNSDNLPNLEKILKNNHYSIEFKREKPLKFYFSNGDEINSNLSLTKAVVKFMTNDVLQTIVNNYDYHVKIDIIHGNVSPLEIYKNISYNLDFECNSLILTPENNYIIAGSDFSNLDPVEKIEKLKKIISSIKEKKAVLFNKNKYVGVNEFRVEKMIKKGFNIVTNNTVNLKEDIENTCIICMNDISIKKIHTKHIHCNGRFCVGCFIKLVTHRNYKYSCPLCKRDCFIQGRELDIFKTISNIKSFDCISDTESDEDTIELNI